jgi:hypothetical protein
MKLCRLLSGTDNNISDYLIEGLVRCVIDNAMVALEDFIMEGGYNKLTKEEILEILKAAF